MVWLDICDLFAQVCAGEDNAKSWTTLEKIVQKERRFISPSKVNAIFREGIDCGGLICRGRKLSEDDNLPVGKVQYYCRDGLPKASDMADLAAQWMDRKNIVDVAHVVQCLKRGWPCMPNNQDHFQALLKINEERGALELREGDEIKVYPNFDGPRKIDGAKPGKPEEADEPPSTWADVQPTAENLAMPTVDDLEL